MIIPHIWSNGVPAVGFFLCLLAAHTTACGQSDIRSSDTSDPALAAGQPVCPDGPDRPRATVSPDYAAIGATGNAIRRGGDYLWIVESGDNTVSRFSPDSGDYDAAFIDVGKNRNPYDVAVDPDADRAYITNYLADSVTVADTATGEVVDEITDDRLDNPAGIAVAGDRLFVTNVAYTDDGFDTGTVAIIDREAGAVAATFESRWKNPQFARRIETADGPRIAISDTGVLGQKEVDGEPRWVPQTPAGLELWTPDAALDEPPRQTWKLGLDEPARVGAPGRALPTPDGNFLYFTSATAPVLFKFDLRERSWVRDADDPIALYDTDDDALHHGAIGPDGILYVTSFNQDALYLYDTTCDERLAGPIDLGVSDELLEGPHGLALDTSGDRRRGYYIFSNANALGRIRLGGRAPSAGK